MKSMIENLINGNLSDAKRQAKRYGFMKIKNACVEYGMTEGKANVTAWYLKGLCSFEEYCNPLNA